METALDIRTTETIKIATPFVSSDPRLTVFQEAHWRSNPIALAAASQSQRSLSWHDKTPPILLGVLTVLA
jgi:hypothetical protein